MEHNYILTKGTFAQVIYILKIIIVMNPPITLQRILDPKVLELFFD